MKKKRPARAPRKQERQWPALDIQLRNTAELILDPANARRHSPQQIATLANLMLRHGFTNPLLIDENDQLIAGEGRLLAARMNLERGHSKFEKLPCGLAVGWTEAEKRAYAIADNQIALSSEWNEARLIEQLTGLKNTEDLDLEGLGFAPDELAALKIDGYALDERLAAAEETPPLPENPITRLGDIWQIGPHRLMCGDSTKAEDVSALLDGAKPHLMVTDPPYGVEYDANWRNQTGIAENGTLQRIKTGRVRKSIGAKALGAVRNDTRVDWSAAWAHFNGNAAYVWHADRHATAVDLSLQSAGFIVRAQIIWNKMRMIIGRGDYHFAHEPCWYAVRKGKPGGWCGDRKQTTVWDITHRASETGHSTQKPVECMRRPILNNSKPGDSVYDPFLGSGTTMIAAQMEGRVCYGMEIDPGYCDVIIQRMATYAGLQAINADGDSFADVKADQLA